MESAAFLLQGWFWPLTPLSYQNPVSCSFLQGNLGCSGGSYAKAWNYATANPIMTYAEYPYTSNVTDKTGSCQYEYIKGEVFVNAINSVL